MQNKLLEELKPNECRYPEGDSTPYHFCGEKTIIGSYCKKHRDIAINKNYVPSRKRKQSEK